MLELNDIQEAAQRIAGQAVRTPLLFAHDLSSRLGADIFIKPEMLQRTGSFKFRGAYNKLSLLDRAQRGAGVVAFSSGNHAQGVAAAAKILGIEATIIMPADAPALKIDNTRAYGAKVIFYNRTTEDREAIANDLCRQTGAALVRPFDDLDIITGQATVGLEIAEDLEVRSLQPDIVLVPVSGGGLLAGCASAIKLKFPSADIYAVEPEAYDDTARSLAAGRPMPNQPPFAPLLCDALGSAVPGQVTFPINVRLVKAGLTVSDQAVLEAMAYGFKVLKLVFEPGGAAGLAAIRSNQITIAGKTVVIVASGGNCDPAVFQRALAQA